MKHLKYLFLFIIIACSSPRVVYDYDTQTNFSEYKTFDFFEDAGKGLNELDKKRIQNSVEKALIAKGMQYSSTPDIYINIVSKQVAVENNNTVGVGIGSGGGNVGFGISTGIPIGGKKINQQLTIDFVEAKKDALIWQGIAEKAIKEKTSPEDREIYFNEVVEKTLSKYPPKKKTSEK